MADTPSASPVSVPSANTTVLTGPGTVVQAGVNAAKEVSTWTPAQVVVIGCVLSMLVSNGLLVWQTVTQHSDRDGERKAASERESIVMRSVEDQREKDRIAVASLNEKILNHCSSQHKEIMSGHAIEREKDRQFVSDNQEKMRTAMGAVGSAIGKLQAAVEKKIPPVDDDGIPFELKVPVLPERMPLRLAPMPRTKSAEEPVFDSQHSVKPRTSVSPIASVSPTDPNQCNCGGVVERSKTALDYYYRLRPR